MSNRQIDSLLAEVTELAATVSIRVPDLTALNSEILRELHDICDGLPYYVAVVNIPKLKPIFFCQKGLDLLGIRDSSTFVGMEFYTRFLSIENLSVVKAGLNHFTTAPTEPFAMTYRVHVPVLGWRWMYGISIPVGDTKTRVNHTVTILRDVEENLENLVRDQPSSNSQILTHRQIRRLLQLSERETEVLKLMAKDLSSKEIADQLHISIDTVQFHRKQLKRKLNVNTLAGLVRYAIYLEHSGD